MFEKRKDLIFIAAAMLCGFFISVEYAIIRPVSNSLFISSYTASWFPYAWLAALPLNFLVVAGYNWLIPRWGALRTFFLVATTVSLVNLFCAANVHAVSAMPFLFYIWKEIYIMLMFQQLWSMIHSTISADRAKYLYGIIFAMGALGGATGSALTANLATKVGSESLLYSTLPIYLLLAGFYLIAYRTSNLQEVKGEEKSKTPLSEGIQLIKNSKVLTFILLLVVAMQMTSTVIDFQFNSHLEKAIPEQDPRTAYAAKVHGVGNICTILLQLFGTFAFLKFLGMKKTHLFIPCLLGLNAVAYGLYPAFGLISYSFIAIKAFDFSLFGVLKEMLYIPLKKEEKFQAKAIIDVFVYRSAKAFSSLAILLLQALVGSSLFWALNSWTILLFASWCGLVVWMMKKDVIPASDV